MKIISLVALLFFTAGVHGQELVGKWKTIDDNTGKARSVVEIYKKGDQYFGKILELIREPGDDPNPICDDCDENDPRFNQPVIGMEIIRNMKFNDEDAILEDGDILDPENGSIYDCKIWIEDGNLKVRGYIMFLYRTQTWFPYEG